MGGTAWSDDHYKARAATRAASSTPTFAYHAATAAAPVHSRKAHDKLNPNGIKMRESRDSKEHPESNAVAILLDVTGSMLQVPTTIQKNLPKLMGLLIRKNYLTDPQILIGAIGDATCDRVPLQIGQFESGIEIEDDLTNLYIEQGGGGQMTESYELGMYLLARKAQLDCLEKRNKRGYCFIIGDEMPYSRVKKHEVGTIIGDTLEADIEIADIVKELEKKFDTYYIIPNLTSYFNNPTITSRWVELLGQNVLRLEQPDGISELIASTIGIAEGVIDLDAVGDDLKEAGTELATSDAVRHALTPYSKARGSRGTEMTVPDSGAPSGVATV